MNTHRDWFDPAVAQANVSDYTWHKNRHTFASRLAMAGVDIRTIAQLMGHATIQMSMRYAHLGSGHNQAAVVVFENKRTPKRTPEKNGIKFFRINAKVAKLADAPDLGSGGATRGGSSPPFRTNEPYR